MIKPSKLSVIIFLLLTGCSTQKKIEGNIENTQAELFTARSDLANKRQAIYVNRPPIDTTIINKMTGPSWSNETVPAISASRMPFSVIANAIGNTAHISTQMADVDPNKPVSVSIPSGTSVDEALKSLASASGYTADTLDNSITWRNQVVRTYDLNAVIGKTISSLGKSKENNTSSSTNSNSSSSSTTTKVINNLNDSANQYNALAIDGDLLSDTVKVLSAMVGKDGSVVGSPSTNIITVMAKGASAQVVDSYMTKLQASIRRQVRLDIKLLTFKSSAGSNNGIDWNLVYQSGKGNVSFDTQNMGTSIASDTSPSKISITSSSGNFSGSQFIVNALQSQGDVSIVTQPTATLVNNRIGTIQVVDKTQFIEALTVTPNENSNASVETELGVYDQGYTLYALPKITDDGDIYLNVSSELSSLVSKDTQTIEDFTVTNPTINNSSFTQTMRLRSGETWIINGYKQSLNQKDGNATLGIPLLGGDTVHSSTNVETIVLITPTLID